MMYLSYRDIPQMTKSRYSPMIPFHDTPWKIAGWQAERGLVLDPDFQRGHVWSDVQRTQFIEYVLRGGRSGRDIYFNHPNWQSGGDGDFVCVDGLQRLTAVLKFLADEIPAFGRLASQYEGRIPDDAHFNFHVANLATRAEVLRWYLDFNTGGTVHSVSEIARVETLLAAEIA
jgi:hypothetical protein